MALPRFPLHTMLFALIAFGCITSGCTSASSSKDDTATAEEEYVQPTGSRISQRVKKGSGGGVAKDMAGGTSSGGTIQRAQQNDGGNVSSSAVPSTK